MAPLNLTAPSTGTIRKKPGSRKMTTQHLRIDMTPMVDLGFLLITFFVLTTQLVQPTAMDLYMPKDGPPTETGRSNALTVLVKEDKIFYYEGEWKEAVEQNAIIQTRLAGENNLRQVIADKKQRLAIAVISKKGKDELMVLIKPSAEASYHQVVGLLDEMTISMVKRYVLLPMNDGEKVWLAKQHPASRF